MILEERAQQSVLLEDGRRLAYADFGDPKGKPVFYFHGFPGSRLEAKVMHEKAEEVGLRLIAVDRPGFGLSDFQPKRRITDWPKDIEEMANILEIDTFSLFGFSTGASYALACALPLAERINLVLTISALGSVEFKHRGIFTNHRIIFWVAKYLPFLFKAFFWIIRCRQLQKENKGERYFKLNFKNFSESDRILLKDSPILNTIAEAHCEAFREGLKGITHEAKLLGSPWGFDLGKIPKNLDIFLFHGEEDKIAPVTSTKEIEELLLHCQATYFQNEGHMSLLANFEEEIFSSIGISIS